MNQDVGGADVVEVTRATLAYNQIEDRISFTCELNNYECVVLWLTARLASQLARYLCDVAAQSPEMASVCEEEEVDNNATAFVDELENYANGVTQDDSQSGSPEIPVVAEENSVSWMVTTIDITDGPMLVQLRFRDEQGHSPVLLSLEHTQLADWSNGLKHCFGLAGWPIDCWYTPASARQQHHATRLVSVH